MDALFEKKINIALRIAARGPSSHNCQPWGLVWLKSDEEKNRLICPSGLKNLDAPWPQEDQLLVLCLNTIRSLGALPSHELEMHLSCGIFSQIFIEAMRLMGHPLVWMSHDDDLLSGVASTDNWPEAWRPLGVLSFCSSAAAKEQNKTKDTDLNDFLMLTVERTTNRFPYLQRPVPRNFMETSAKRADILKGGVRSRLHFIHDDERKKQIGRLVAQYAGIDFSFFPAWNETYSFIRFTDKEMRNAQDGIFIQHLMGDASGVTRRLIKSLLNPYAIQFLKYAGFCRFLAHQLGALVSASPALVCFSFEDCHGPRLLKEVTGGRLLGDFWLTAQRHGLSLHPVSVMLQHPDSRIALQRRLNIPGRIFFFSRLGYPSAQSPPTPRRRGAPIKIVWIDNIRLKKIHARRRSGDRRSGGRS